MMDNMGGWVPGFGAVLMILFWGLVILGALALLKRWLAGSAGSSLEIQKERYARGAIDLEQYKRAPSELEN